VHDSAERFRNLGIDVFFGHGKFAGPSLVEVNGLRLEFTRALIATGSRPSAPAIPGLDVAGYLTTSETVFALQALPQRIAIIGAGPVGCELAQALARFGAEVFLIEALHGVLPDEERDAAEIVGRALTEGDGVKLLCCSKEVQISKAPAGAKRFTLQSHGRRYEAVVDEILVAAGRAPNLEELHLDAAGIDYSTLGVLVDARLRTSNPRVFAAGDVCSNYKFTHAADAMARIVLANALFHARRKVTGLVMPWCTYTDPEIAHVGWYEEAARAAGYDVASITEPVRHADRAMLDGETDGFARVLYQRRSGAILGATVVGRDSGELINELTLAITAKQRISIFSSTIHAYPTRAEVLRKIGDEYMRGKLTPVLRNSLARWFAWRRA
jgi:pyruvate/2-oxoglutarate dehydrogenase complex dihydrolipoamide dehydrogenase (E3) component